MQSKIMHGKKGQFLFGYSYKENGNSNKKSKGDKK